MATESELPVILNYSGRWLLESRSESVEALFAAMDVPWLARKLVGNMRITSEITHTAESLWVTDHALLGTFTLTLVPDGRWRPVQQVNKVAAPMRCAFDASTSELRIETRFPVGVLSDRRVLTSRTAFAQTLSFVRSGAASAPPVQVRRYFSRAENEEERGFAEAAETSARLAMAHQAATLSLLSGGVHFAPEPALADADADAAPPLPPLPDAPDAPAPASAPAPALPPCADFSGAWVLDRSRSDTLDAMLVIMGVPWIARKIANSLEVTAVIKHDVAAGRMLSEDHSSMGVTANAYVLDGVARAVKSKDGKTSIVTASILPVAWPLDAASPPPTSAAALAAAPLRGAAGALRIVSVLPDGAGETVDTRCLVDGGRTLRQLLVYSKPRAGGAVETSALLRMLVNKEHDPARWAASLARLEAAASGGGGEAAAPPPAAAAAAAAAAAVAAAAPRAAASTLPPLPPPLPAAPPSLDPFFVSLSGQWAVDWARSDSLDGLWRSIGLGWLVRRLVGSLDVAYTLAHARGAFSVGDRSALGAHVASLPLDGRWHAVRQLDGKVMPMRGVQLAGGGDRGPHWLGDIGWVPDAWLTARAAASGDGDGGDGDGGEDDERALALEARGVGVALRGFPVNVAPLTRCEVEVVTALAAVDAPPLPASLELPPPPALAAAAEAAAAVAPPSDAPRLVFHYLCEARDELTLTYTHYAPGGGGALHSARRVLRRVEAPEQRAAAELADAARIQHACTLIVARRSAADELKAAYERRRGGGAGAGAAAGSAGAAAGGADAAARKPDAGSFSDDDEDEDESLAEGQCALA